MTTFPLPSLRAVVDINTFFPILWFTARTFSMMNWVVWGGMPLWFCSVRDALFQAISVRAAPFAPIDLAVTVEVNFCRRPFWGDIDAVPTLTCAPPIESHKKFFIRKDASNITRCLIWTQISPDDSILCVQDVANVLCTVL